MKQLFVLLAALAVMLLGGCALAAEEGETELSATHESEVLEGVSEPSYYDEWDFRPYVTALPIPEGMEPKGAVALLAGGAYQFRGDYTDTLPTALHLRALGFYTFGEY